MIPCPGYDCGFTQKHKKVFISEIVTNDETTMRSNISHTGGKAKLPHDVHTPRF